MNSIYLEDSKNKVARLQVCVAEVTSLLDGYDNYSGVGGAEIDESIENCLEDIKEIVNAIGNLEVRWDFASEREKEEYRRILNNDFNGKDWNFNYID